MRRKNICRHTKSARENTLIRGKYNVFITIKAYVDLLRLCATIDYAVKHPAFRIADDKNHNHCVV